MPSSPVLRSGSPKGVSPDSSDSEGDACWVCLGEGTQNEPLEHPCKCPRTVHRACLSRWQLQSAGRSEERVCRFCKETLPDWREGVTPQGLRPASPIMSIHHNGETFMVKVSPGPDGMAKFQAEVRRLLRLEEDQEFDISFECRVPGAVAAASPAKMELKGMNAYDAAVYCASITAGERLQHAQQMLSQRATRQEVGSPEPVAPVNSPQDTPITTTDNNAMPTGEEATQQLAMFDMGAVRTGPRPSPHPLAGPASGAGYARPQHLLQTTLSLGAPSTSPDPQPGGPRQHRTTSAQPAAQHTLPPLTLPSLVPVTHMPLVPATALSRVPGGYLGPFGQAFGQAAAAAAQAGAEDSGEPLRVGRRTSRNPSSGIRTTQSLLPNASFQAVLRRRPMTSPDQSSGGSDAECDATDATDMDADSSPRQPLAPAGFQQPIPLRWAYRTAAGNGIVSRTADQAILTRARHSASLNTPPATRTSRYIKRAASAMVAPDTSVPSDLHLPSPALSLPVVRPDSPPHAIDVPYGACSSSGDESSQSVYKVASLGQTLSGAAQPSPITGMSAFAAMDMSWMTEDLLGSFPAEPEAPAAQAAGTQLQTAGSSRTHRSTTLADVSSVQAALSTGEQQLSPYLQPQLSAGRSGALAGRPPLLQQASSGGKISAHGLPPYVRSTDGAAGGSRVGQAAAGALAGASGGSAAGRAGRYAGSGASSSLWQPTSSLRKTHAAAATTMDGSSRPPMFRTSQR